MTFVYLDTETTGLDRETAQIIEVAWAVGNGEIHSVVLPHSLVLADPYALQVNRYYARHLYHVDPEADAMERALMTDLMGATVVGSNPGYDTDLLRRRWHAEPWHYQTVDLASYGAGVLGLDRPVKLAALVDCLEMWGYVLPEPDHSAAGDVKVARFAHTALMTIRKDHDDYTL